MKRLFLALSVIGLFTITAGAAIQIGSAGYTETFTTYPASTEWSTLRIGSTGYGSAANLTAAVQAIAASSISTAVSNAGTASYPTQMPEAQWSSANTGKLQTRPTGVGACLLLATVQNNTGGTAHRMDISYTLGRQATARTEQIDGQLVYYSLDGTAGSWVQFTTITATPGPQSASIPIPAGWANGSILYIVWADDNASGGTDDGFTLDNMEFVTDNITIPLIVTLNSPANGILTTSTLNPASAMVTATVGTTPATSVSFYTNDVLFFTDTTVPYSNQLINLPIGTYSVYAKAESATETAYSVTNTLTVRSEFIHFTGATITNSFDADLGVSPTVTPQGWYVGFTPYPGANTPASDVIALSVGDGSSGPSPAAGWNYGLSGDSDRALGTAATSTSSLAPDRDVVVRIQNNTSSNIISFQIQYDGEVWRNYTTEASGITNLVSYDYGATWELTGADFYQPFAAADPPAAVNGNDPANRVANVQATITPATPVGPGAVIYIRWFDRNEAGTDGDLAIDNFSFTVTAFERPTTFVTITSPAEGAILSAGCSTATITANVSASFLVTNVTVTLDGTTTLSDGTVPYSVVFSGVGVGPHTLVATAYDPSGTFSTTNTFTVTGNQAPIAAFTAVYSGGVTGNVFRVGTSVTNAFGAFDNDGTLASLEFLVNGNTHFVTNISYVRMVVNDLLAGTNTFTVRATDNCGVVAEASQIVVGTNPPNVTLLVTNGSMWKYHAAASEPPVDGSSRAWNLSAYDDSSWLSGQGELGAGDAVTPPNTNPERTVIDIGPSGNRYHTVYFRHSFVASNVSQFSGLIINALNDDGSAVYLNGTLMATFHLTNVIGTPITYNDLAGIYSSNVTQAIPDDGCIYFSSNVLASALINGTNVLAVEVHQDAIGSSDLSFDLMLWGETGAAAGPRLTITQGDATHVTIKWDASAAGYNLQQNGDLGNSAGWSTLIPGVAGDSQTTVLSSGTPMFFRLKQ